MPELKSSSEKKAEPKAPVTPKDKVISAYSEEGQQRIKDSQAKERRFKIIFVVVFVLVLIALGAFIIVRSMIH